VLMSQRESQQYSRTVQGLPQLLMLSPNLSPAEPNTTLTSPAWQAGALILRHGPHWCDLSHRAALSHRLALILAGSPSLAGGSEVAGFAVFKGAPTGPGTHRTEPARRSTGDRATPWLALAVTYTCRGDARWRLCRGTNRRGQGTPTVVTALQQ
jgi:hypothetical protein